MDHKNSTEYSQRLVAEDPPEEGNIPSPAFKRKASEKSGNYDQFS